MLKLRGIYVIEGPTGRMYIGCSTNIVARWASHKHQLILGKHACPELQQAWLEHAGVGFTFRVLQHVEPALPLIVFENLWMARYVGQLYNAMPENRHGPASRYKLSQAQLAAWIERYAKGTASLSSSQRQQLSVAMRSWVRKPGVREGMRARARAAGVVRYIRTPEAVANNAAAQRGVPKSARQRDNMSRAHSDGRCRCHPKQSDA